MGNLGFFISKFYFLDWFYVHSKTEQKGDSLEAQWLGLCTLTAEGPGFGPWLGN